jgi:hypothetical protein
MDNKTWREDQKHLPDIMRDFHDCKDLFKTIDQYIVCEDGHPAEKVSWVQGHCYTVDVFLWFMAQHGYTLQKSRAKVEFDDLGERLRLARKERSNAFAKLLAP